jgi:hypothetical protein
VISTPTDAIRTGPPSDCSEAANFAAGSVEPFVTRTQMASREEDHSLQGAEKMEDVPFRGNRESTLAEILAEPVLLVMMQRDGVNEVQVRQLMTRAKPQQAAILHRWITLSLDDDDDPPPRTPGVVARSRVIPPWPRVFPGL